MLVEKKGLVMSNCTVVVRDMWTDEVLGRFTAETRDAAWDAAWAKFGWVDDEIDVKFFEEKE
jgi:hypothetical protein